MNGDGGRCSVDPGAQAPSARHVDFAGASTAAAEVPEPVETTRPAPALRDLSPSRPDTIPLGSFSLMRNDSTASAPAPRIVTEDQIAELADILCNAIDTAE